MLLISRDEHVLINIVFCRYSFMFCIVAVFIRKLLAHIKLMIVAHLALNNKSKNAISKGACMTCKYRPKEEEWSIICNCLCTCYSGEMWEPLE